METFLRPPVLMYRHMRNMYLCTRSFKTRSGSQSIGLGSSSTASNSQDKFYEDKKMQSLWEDTFERISSMQQDSAKKQAINDHETLNTNGRLADTTNNQSQSQSTLSSSQQAGKLKNGSKFMFPLSDQQLMKLSFAEGYFYGQSNFKKEKDGGFLSKLKDRYVIIIVLSSMVFYGLLITKGTGPLKSLLNKTNFEIRPEDIDVSFADVKGCDESKQELYDIVEYLKNPKKFSRLGGKLPKGVLLVGPPGTGKTLLARAVAGEAGVPFFQASGSEFDEILVGQGARRVRDLFEKAKARTPCVIFIDEIDSVGGKRSNSVLHPYANQTINQLLSEMDGFNQNEGVIVIGATNRANDLDKALLRPGRFDVQLIVPAPDYKGRKELFDHYLGKVRASTDIDLDTLCRTTVGFTGADIENLVNQAALKSATDNMETVTLESLEFARDKILMGPERKTRLQDRERNLMTAYHESGHALVAYFTEKANSLHKVTIVSRGASLGHTSIIPERDVSVQTKEQLSANMDVMLGGRVAEELIFGIDKVTTGCEDDLKRANMLAIKMVKDWGMSEKISMRVVREEVSENSLVQVVHGFSDATSAIVDSEISRLLNESRERVKELLTTHRNELNLLAEALLKYETLDAAEVKLVLEGKEPRNLRQEKEKDKEKLGRVTLKNLKPTDRLPLDLLK